MESDTFVLFRGGKRITLQDGDLSVENICRVFQVRRSSLYLTDDANRAIMPEPAGHFSTLYMSNRGHYEVHGEPEQSQSPAGRAPAPSPTPPPTFPFSFMHQASSSSTGSAASHGAPRARGRFPQKSFHRRSQAEEVISNMDHLKKAAESLPDITSSVNQLFELAKAKSAVAKSLTMTPIKDAFTCMICRAVMKQPMVSTCCESLLGCQTCVEQWLTTSDLCLSLSCKMGQCNNI
ncbi:uncharacterized protein LOC114454771 isoform X1 [Gouania willdenowi]|uniref:uncharacterized protein LOC114454771 isoform X1 n=1 Tax=Gouania willdenowi TaxID=441366 RepID=UPI001056314D|nr:uncharacterized protein LOC114454771 isoform X1 [Gouania willdenowi]